MSTFYGLEIARKSLFVNQKALDVTGHNLANANTPGYSRQSLVLSSIEPPSASGTLGQSTTVKVGGGVEIQQLTQIRDSFLDVQFRKENRYSQEWLVKADGLQYIEDIFNEPSDTGINASLKDFSNGFQELSKYPESIEIRTLVTQNAIKLTETIHHLRNQLVQLQDQQNTSIEITVLEINDIAKSIKDLNLQIYKFEEGGAKANDLRDRRNVLLDQLSGLIDYSYNESTNGKFRIDINGFPLVEHSEFNLLSVSKDISNPIDSNDLFSIQWKDTGLDVRVSGGKLKGYMDMRDGITSDRTGIPYFVDQLDQFSKALVQEFNRIHQQGYTIPYGEGTSQTGQNFFSTYNNISLDSAILDSVYNIAASSQPLDDPDSGAMGNNINALAMAALRNRSDIEIIIDSKAVRIGGFEDFTKKLIAGLAVESSHAAKMYESQSILTMSIENRRLSVSGVSIDEEMSNMIRFQHSYSAAARMVTAMDQLLETLIMRTGVVGR